MRQALLLAFMLLLAAPGARAANARLLARLTVQAGKSERVDTPVCAVLEGVPTGKPMRLEEVREGARTAVPCQVEPGTPARLWWILSGTTPANTTRTFELVEGVAASAPKIDAVAAREYVDIVYDGAKVLRYHTAEVVPPAGVERKFARSGYIHPAWTPGGFGVTDDFPPDHRHQHGIFQAWTHADFEGRHLDFWNLGGQTAKARCISVDAPNAGPVFGSFRAHHELVDLKAPGGEKVALNETLDVRVWRVGGPGKGYFLWDFTSTQRCATASPVTFPQYYYGGMGFRATADWMKEARFLTSEGKGRKDGDNSTARWVALCGPAAGKTAGTLILSHPLNFRHPEPLRLNPVQPQLCLAPSQQGPWTMEPGKEYVWRYRFCVYDGETDARMADRLWSDFAQPPVVSITR